MSLSRQAKKALEVLRSGEFLHEYYIGDDKFFILCRENESRVMRVDAAAAALELEAAGYTFRRRTAADGEYEGWMLEATR